MGQGITNCVYRNNGFDLQSKIHATQSDLYLLILSMSLLVEICPSGAVTQDFILIEDGADIFFLRLICALRCCRRLAAQSFWSGKKKTEEHVEP